MFEKEAFKKRVWT